MAAECPKITGRFRSRAVVSRSAPHTYCGNVYIIDEIDNLNVCAVCGTMPHNARMFF